MELLVRYQPVGEDWYEFDIESGILIKKQRNKPAVCNINLPNTFTTTKASAYANLQVLLNDQYLFDGHTEDKGYGKDQHQLVAYDWLWDFTRQRRIMEQGTTAITPSEAFTDVFDNNGTSAYFNGVWGESYTGPWIDGYNATRYIVPAETSAIFGDPFFDCVNKDGLEFMKFLADISYVGDKYRYFYWYENINGTRYLFFEPDGWGTTHENLDYIVTNNLNEKTSDIYNDIEVWGGNLTGKIPLDADAWTERTIADWTATAGVTLSLSTTVVPNAGDHSLSIAIAVVTLPIVIRHYLMQDGSGINLETLRWVAGAFYGDAAFNNQQVAVSANTNSLNYYYSNYEAIAVPGVFENHFFTKAEIEANSFGAPDWTNIEYIEIWWNRTAGTFNGATHYLDNFYLEIYPMRSENNSDTTGQDATSIATYRTRRPNPIKFSWIDNVTDCNSYANVMCKYYKDPQYKLSMKWNDFMNFRLNDNINFTEYQKNITLPIDKLAWNFKAEDEIETSVDLGLPRLSIKDLLSKYSTAVIEPGKDWGHQYFVW